MFWSIATRSDVVRQALKVALVVGAILIAINHGDALMTFEVESSRLARMLLTILVPYCVSTYSSVKAIQSFERNASGS